MKTQLSLFDGEPPSQRIDGFAGVPGLTYWAGFLKQAEQARILADIDAREWRRDLKRRVQHYGYKYDYRARSIDSSMYVGPLPPFAEDVGHVLQTRGLMAEAPNQVIVNEYLPGQGISMHIDCEPCFKDTIATISLGSECLMDLKEKETGQSLEVKLELGSCLVFSGVARYQWQHGIKARKSDYGIPRQRRVSLTFRCIIPPIQP